MCNAALSTLAAPGQLVDRLWAMTRAGQLKPGLEMLGNGLVQQRAFGVAGVVDLGFGCCCWLGCSKRSVARWVVRMGSAVWLRCGGVHRAMPCWS